MGKLKLKSYLSWLIVGITGFFVLKAFKDHWQTIASVKINQQGWFILGLALIATLLAHIWSGWVWTWILKCLRQSVSLKWALRVYLITNLAKYIPGNVGHFYSRIVAISKAGSSLGAASLSVLLEPLLMAAAALLIALVSCLFGVIELNSRLGNWAILLLGLGIILLGIHPYILNPVMNYLSRLKNKNQEIQKVYLENYPGLPLLGEMGFVLLRGLGFLLIWLALMPIERSQILPLISSFSFAWLLGLVVPGAPGGMGVFEATAIALLDRQQFPPGIVLITVALYRVVSIIAEVLGAGIGQLIKVEGDV